MMHGPCGAANPRQTCMIGSNKCKAKFPKPFADRTTVNEDGYPIYKRRDNGSVVYKSSVPLDNGYVVPYNPGLLLKYRAHINVEWCNQARSIKYLFKYINKGPDYISISTTQNNHNGQSSNQTDQIKNWMDCRYISPCEAVWRIFGFEIHYRHPPVEKLTFHLPDEQNVVFNDEDPIDEVVDKENIHRTKFTAWMECNAEYPEARQLTYSELLMEFT
jgi:hypothetical protein